MGELSMLYEFRNCGCSDSLLNDMQLLILAIDSLFRGVCC